MVLKLLQISNPYSLLFIYIKKLRGGNPLSFLFFVKIVSLLLFFTVFFHPYIYAYSHKYINLKNCKLCHVSKDYKKVRQTPANCTTGICHQNIFKNKYIHGPVGMKLCIACHNPHGSKSKSLLRRTGAKLCYYCHKDSKLEFDKKYIHKPVKEGKCILCHDPHSSNLKYQLKGKNIGNFCYKCHDKKKFLNKKYVHGPVGVGRCLDCHDPHASNKRFLLREYKGINILCFKCHNKKRFINGNYVHGPVGGGLCTKCHDPHCSNNKNLLILPLNEGELCFDCHNRFKIIDSKYEHGPVGAGLCLQCHKIHSSKFKKLLVAKLKNGYLCLKCHKNMANRIKGKKFIHYPVKKDCTNCHDPHGSPYRYQLIGNPKIEVCLKCHKDKAKEYYTPGEKIHPIIKEKGCKACHDPHASNYKYQLFAKINPLCKHCHVRFKNIKRGHPVERHPIKGKRNPLNKREKFNCTSCHNPHFSKYNYLLIDTMRDFRLCRRCHNY